MSQIFRLGPSFHFMTKKGNFYVIFSYYFSRFYQMKSETGAQDIHFGTIYISAHQCAQNMKCMNISIMFYLQSIAIFDRTHTQHVLIDIKGIFCYNLCIRKSEIYITFHSIFKFIHGYQRQF